MVLSVNGDTLTDFDFRLAGATLLDRGADALIVVKERSTAIDFGVVEFDADRATRGYAEKPALTHLVSTGINALRGSAIRRWLPAGHMDMPELLLAIRNGGGTVACLRTDAAWLDLGRPEDLAAANALRSGG